MTRETLRLLRCGHDDALTTFRIPSAQTRPARNGRPLMTGPDPEEAFSEAVRAAFGPRAALVAVRVKSIHKAHGSLSMTVLTRDMEPLEPSATADIFTLLDQAETLLSDGLHPLKPAAGDAPATGVRDRQHLFSRLRKPDSDATHKTVEPT